MKSIKVALLAGLMGLVGVAEAGNEAMPYCFHLDGNTDNAGSAVLSTDYKITKDGTSYDSFTTTAKFGTKGVGGGSSGAAGTYYLTAPTVGDALIPADSDWTLSMWVNYRSSMTMWCNVGGFSIGENCFRIQRTNQNTYQLYCTGISNVLGISSDTAAIPAGSTSDWVNLAFVFHASTHTLDIYSNGTLWGLVTQDAFESQALTTVSMGNYVLSSIAGGTLTKDGRSSYPSAIDEVAVYNFAANGSQIEWLGENAPSTAMFGVEEPKEITAYYKSGYFGNSSNQLTLVDENDKNIAYTGTESDWTIIIDSDHLASGTTTAWCSEQSYYRNNAIRIVKIIVRAPNFTFKPGVTAALFDGVELEVAEGAKLTLSNDSSRNMSVGAVTFSGEGEVEASSGVTFTKDITINGNVQVDLPSGTFVAEYDGNKYMTLAKAIEAAGTDGIVDVLVNSLTGGSIPETWRGTVRFTGTLPNEFDPAQYGNANSVVEFNGVSGGWLKYSGSFAGTLKVTNKGETKGWTIDNGYGDDNFVFGALTGDGDIVDGNTGITQQYSFKDVSTFSGSLTTAGKRFIVGQTTHGSKTQYTARIYIEKGYVAHVAAGKTWEGKWGMIVDGEIKGSGTLACPGDKKVIFGFANDAATTIDLSEGALTIAEGCSVQFNKPLTLKNVSAGDVILNCSSKPANLETVQLKNEDGEVMTLGSLKYADGKVTFVVEKNLHTQDVWTLQTATEMAAVPNGYKLDLTDYLALDQAPIVLPVGTTTEEAAAFLAKLHVVPPTIRKNATLAVKDNTLAIAYEAMTLYWAAWRGTFWEHIGQTDANGNHGLMRDESGNLNIAHRPNDTVVFDKTHYTVGGEYLTTQYWHYDENLYIKNEVIPGDTNDWDLKILDGVTLKMGLRGARATGQNVISKLKIYVEAGSTLELGYWGNTHHYQGVIRDDVTFGGAGTITLGDDMGTSCRIEGNLKVKQDPSAQETEVPTLDVRGKELVVKGGQIDVKLTGFGALSGSGTITTPITFNNATIDATDAKGFTFKNETTFTGNLTVDLTSAPTGKDLVKICTKGEGGSFVFTEGIDVIVRVGGEVQPAFYTLDTDNDGNLCVKVAPVTITYDADVVLGYDYKTMICRVWMSPAIEGVIAKVTVKNVGDNLKTWTAPVIGMRGSGRCEVLVGDADNYFEPGTYSMTVLIGGTTLDPIEYNLEVLNDGKLAKVGEVGYDSMENAVAAAKSSGGTITLLTNVFFAAPEGMYSIARNGFDIMPVNYTTIDVFTNEVTAENEVIFERGGEGIARVVIAGDWIAAGLPWRTKKAINTDIWVKAETMEMAPFEAYVLGIPAETWTTETIIARGVETGDPETIKIDDGLTLKDASDTGVVVTRKLIDADTRATVSETNVLELKNVNKVKLLKLAYDFAADGGQE